MPRQLQTSDATASDSDICQACGACCAYSSQWPRFTLEDDATIAHIPENLVTLTGMRCLGDRCAALYGQLGEAVSCSIYAVRPEVCRDCEIGDDACTMARERHGLPPLTRRAD